MGIKAIPAADQVISGNEVENVITYFANVAAAQTNLSQIAAQGAGLKIKVVGMQIVIGGTATAVTLNSNTTAITPLMAGIAGAVITLPPCGIRYFETAANEPLTITTGAGSTTGLMIQYVVSA